MENLVDIFSGDAFSVTSLSEAINIVPIQYGRVSQAGIFTPKGINTTTVSIEMNNGVLNLIPSTSRRDPAPKNKTGKRSAKILEVPHFPLDDLIYPDDIQNVRAFGTAANLKTPASEVNDRLEWMSRKHDLTHEYLRCGAISGIVKDADGDTLLNLFTEFGVTETDIDFELDDDNTDVIAKAQEVTGTMEDNLNGDVMAYAHAFCSPGFWARFIAHPQVQAAYNFYQSTQNAVRGYAGVNANPQRDDVRKGFVWQGILWEEYRGKGTFLNSDGTTSTRNFIETDKARFVPIGTNESFREYNAPANWHDTVNTVGQNKYAKVVPEIGGRWVEVLTQSNKLPICMRPKLLIKGTKF
jgi:hypothetical protein